MCVCEAGNHTGHATPMPPLGEPLCRLPPLPAQELVFALKFVDELGTPYFAITTVPIVRTHEVSCDVHLLPRVALCEVAPLEVVLRHLVHVAPGAFCHVLPRHLDVNLENATDKATRARRIRHQ